MERFTKTIPFSKGGKEKIRFVEISSFSVTNIGYPSEYFYFPQRNGKKSHLRVMDRVAVIYSYEDREEGPKYSSQKMGRK
jgi:hypothetical protein